MKAASQYGQNVLVQQVVLLAIRDLQQRMFAHLMQADLTRVEREAPAALAARFTTDATVIRDALVRTVNGIADITTVVGVIASMTYLDWVLSVLDAESEAAVQMALTTLRAGRTTLIVAHRLSTVRDADLIVAMADGRAVEQGTHAQLLAADGLYARLVRTQAFVA